MNKLQEVMQVISNLLKKMKKPKQESFLKMMIWYYYQKLQITMKSLYTKYMTKMKVGLKSLKKSLKKYLSLKLSEMLKN